MRHEINLFDPSLRRPKVLLPARHVLLAWGVSAVGLLGIYAWELSSVTGAGARAKALHAEAAVLQDQVQKLGEAQASRRPSAEIQAQVARRETDRAHHEAVLGRLRDSDFGSTEGHARYLRALARQAPSGLWLTGVTVGGSGQDIRLEGRTLEPPLVARYLANLGSELPLKGHAFNNLEFRRPGSDAPVEGASAPSKDATPRFLEFSVASRAEADVGGPGRKP